MSEQLTIHPSIQDSLSCGKPVVALESTVITHGLPYPENLKVTRDMMKAVSDSGARPAVLAVYKGRCTIGLDESQIEELAQSKNAMKCSLRDLPVACTRGLHGSTTVAATMHLAQLAGIPVFATGGIGGVHRGAPEDVSADLTALGEINMIVVCSGAKSILDLHATREQLETRGVLVAGWQSSHFPAFYARESGLQTDVLTESADDVSQLYESMQSLKQSAALLLTVPVPEDHALLPEDIDPHIAMALAAASAQGITGKETTPFLLEEIRKITGNRSMEANTALLVNNAGVAGKVAVAVAAN